MLGILNTAISLAAKLPIFKKGSGKATVSGLAGITAGVIGATVGAEFIGGVLNAENLVPAIEAGAKMLAQVAAIIAAFGFGRKAAST